MIEVLRCAVAAAAAAFVLVAAFQLMRGKWLWLVASQAAPAHNLARQKEAEDARIGILAAPVCLAYFAAVASLLFYELGSAAGIEALAAIFSMLCDLSMVALLVLVVRMYLKLGGAKDPKAKYRAGYTRISLFVLALVVSLTALSLLFAL